MTRGSLISLFADYARFARGRAIVFTRGYRRWSWTYGELASNAVFCVKALESYGIRSGDRVLLWAPNSAEWVAAFWGCLLGGTVAVPMDDAASIDFASRVARESQVKLVVASRNKPQLDAAIPVLALEDLSGSSAYSVPRGTAFPETIASKPLIRKDIAEILFTSGTTAEPRGVVLTHGNFLANLEPIEHGVRPYLKYERFLHPLRFVSLVPLSHVFGQFMALFVPPLLGATVIFENSTNPAEILRTVKRERATVLIAVPRMLEMLRSAIEREIDSRGWRAWFDKNYAAAEKQPFLRRAWRFRRIHRLFGFRFWAFICGGAALGADTELFFKRLGFAVVQGYGMTETASLISLNHPFSAAEGSVGKILPGREFKLAEDGEILVRGENVSSAYWGKGGAQQSADDGDGWLRTGDLGEVDAQGNLKFRGRKKNVIVTPTGLNIYPEDLEAALKKQPGIRDAVVIPVNRSGNAEACAVVLVREVKDVDDGKEVKEGSVSVAIEAANATLAEYQQIRNWLVWPELDFPRTPTGKPRLGAIAEEAELKLGTTWKKSPPAGEADPLARILSSVSSTSSAELDFPRTLTGKPRLGAIAEEAELKLGTTSTSLNSLSSLDRVELLSTLEHRYNIEIDESVFSEAKSVADLQKLIAPPTVQAAGRNAASIRETGARYRYPRWAQREPVRLARLAVYYTLVWPATQILGHPRIVGRHHLKDLTGPVIVISNHITRRADIGLILAALPARFRHRLATAMGGESLARMRRPPRDWFFAKRWAYSLGYWLVTALFNVFPLPQFSGFRESFRFAGESADRGYSVLIFPEGEVNNSADGRMAPFQSGIGLLAENLLLPIVPMRLDGVWQMKREHRRLARFGEITVHIGPPITFPRGTPVNEIARQLEAIVAAL